MKKLILLFTCIMRINAYSQDCSTIEREKDDFTGAIKINSELTNGSTANPLIIYKRIEKNITSYYLRLGITNQPTCVVDGNSATILYDDGTKTTISTDIKVEAGDDGFDYRAFFKVSSSLLDELSKKKVDKFRLYIFDTIVNKEVSQSFLDNVNCVITSK